MKYITLFETITEYNEAILDLPNVSLIEKNMSVYFNPYVPETRVVAKYNVTDTVNPTPISFKAVYGDGTIGFSSIEIDGVVQQTVESEYTFSTTGEHIVKYTLADPTTIVGYAFYNCSSITSVSIPNSVTTIGVSSFSRCFGLTSIYISGNVTNIDSSAFTNCSGLTSITIDSNNAVYDSRNNCNAIIETSTNKLIQGCKNTVIPNNITSIDDYAFSRCCDITSITIPNGVTSIGEHAFQNCSSLTSMNIPGSVVNIRNFSFSDCSSLSSCTIGYGVEKISQNAFTNCSSLTSITIPSSVTSIGGMAFQDCSSLSSITCNSATAPAITKYTFQDINTGGTLTVPQGSTGYDVWMGTGNYYLGKYNWTKVEQ